MIVDWQEIADERSGELDQIRAVRRYTRSFRIVTDNIYDGPETILLSSNFLGLLTLYIESRGLIEGVILDPGAVLRTVRVSQPDKDNPFIWLLVYEYSSEPLDVQQRGVTDNSGGGGGGGGGGGSDNGPASNLAPDPLTRPPVFTLDIAKFQRVVNADASGAAVVNSAGAPFSPLPEADDTRLVLTMERNEAEAPSALMFSYQDAINSDLFLGALPGTAKVNVKAASMFENNEYYWKVTYTFEFRAYVNVQGLLYSGWDLHLLDQGFYYLNSSGVPTAFRDSTGSPASDPQLLDGAGNPATGGITSIQVVSGGSGYSGPLLLEITGGSGAGAAAWAVGASSANAKGSPITSVVVTNPGSGYKPTDVITVTGTGGLGTGATFKAVVGPRPVYRHYRPYNWLPFAVFNLPAIIT